jgi:hypothetical protein
MTQPVNLYFFSIIPNIYIDVYLYIYFTVLHYSYCTHYPKSFHFTQRTSLCRISRCATLFRLCFSFLSWLMQTTSHNSFFMLKGLMSSFRGTLQNSRQEGWCLAVSVGLQRRLPSNILLLKFFFASSNPTCFFAPFDPIPWPSTKNCFPPHWWGS